MVNIRLLARSREVWQSFRFGQSKLAQNFRGPIQYFHSVSTFISYWNFFRNEDEKYLQLTKKDYCTEEKSFNDKECAKGYFDDGWVYKWVEGIKPRHIHFEVKMSAGSNQLETCGVHFYNLESDPKNTEIELSTYKDKWVTGPKGPNGFARSPNADVFLFRLGYFEHMKLNVNSMVKET